MSRLQPTGGYYDQAAAPFAAANAQNDAALSDQPPKVAYNPDYYNTPAGQAELKQAQQSDTNAQVGNLQHELQRQSQLVADGGQVFTPEQIAQRRDAIQSAQGALTTLQPLVQAGAIGPDTVRQAVGTAANDSFNDQRRTMQAQRDWAAIDTASRSTFTQQQTASAAASFEKEYGLVANKVQGFLQFKGNQAPVLGAPDFMALRSKLFSPAAGIDPDAMTSARDAFLTASEQISQPGVTKQDAAAMQQQFVALHPDFAKQVGIPQPMQPEQLEDFKKEHTLKSAEQQAGDVPIMQDAKGNPIVNPGWVAKQKHSIDSLKIQNETGTLAHQKVLETRNQILDYLKFIMPGKEEQSAPDYDARLRHFHDESRRLLARPETPGAPPQPQPLNVPAPATPPARAQETVDRNAPAAFVDGPRAEAAFHAGQIPAGKQFLIRGKPFVFDSKGAASAVK